MPDPSCTAVGSTLAQWRGSGGRGRVHPGEMGELEGEPGGRGPAGRCGAARRCEGGGLTPPPPSPPPPPLLRLPPPRPPRPWWPPGAWSTAPPTWPAPPRAGPPAFPPRCPPRSALPAAPACRRPPPPRRPPRHFCRAGRSRGDVRTAPCFPPFRTLPAFLLQH